LEEIIKKDENQVNLKITSEAASDHRNLFGPIGRKEIQLELKYYITKLLEAKRTPGKIINYDNEKAIFLEKIDSDSYEVIGFGLVTEYCV